LKLKCDELLSNFAFEFNLRRYTECQREHWATEHKQACSAAAAQRDASTGRAAGGGGGNNNNKKNKKGKGKGKK
jgi:hypothetical protein